MRCKLVVIFVRLSIYLALDLIGDCIDVLLLLNGCANVTGLLAIELSKYSLNYDQEGSVALHGYINVSQFQNKQYTYHFAQEERQDVNYVLSH